MSTATSGTFELSDETRGKMILQETREFRRLAPSHSLLGALGCVRSAFLAFVWQLQWIAFPADTVVVNCDGRRFGNDADTEGAAFDEFLNASAAILAGRNQWLSMSVLIKDVGRAGGRETRSIIPSMLPALPHLFG